MNTPQTMPRAHDSPTASGPAPGSRKATRDYADAVRSCSAAELEKRVLQATLAAGLSACLECCDRWAEDGAVALEWYGASGERKTVTFAQLRRPPVGC